MGGWCADGQKTVQQCWGQQLCRAIRRQSSGGKFGRLGARCKTIEGGWVRAAAKDCVWQAVDRQACRHNCASKGRSAGWHCLATSACGRLSPTGVHRCTLRLAAQPHASRPMPAPGWAGRFRRCRWPSTRLRPQTPRPPGRARRRGSPTGTTWPAQQSQREGMR